MTSSASSLIRLPQPPASETVVPFTPRHFTATLLLDAAWQLDIPAVAVTTAVRFPMIGRVRPLRGRIPNAPPGVEIDGAKIALRYVPEPLPPDEEPLPNPPRGNRHSESGLPRHVAYVDVSCCGNLPGVEGAKAYAAAVHFVASAACAVAPVCAVLWRTGRVLSSPGAFQEGAETILGGGVPLGSWVSFPTASARVDGVPVATGMLSHGLRAFVGWELELAPQPVSPTVAWHVLSYIARIALEDGMLLNERDRVGYQRSSLTIRVRDRRPTVGRPASSSPPTTPAIVPAPPVPGCRSR